MTSYEVLWLLVGMTVGVLVTLLGMGVARHRKVAAGAAAAAEAESTPLVEPSDGRRSTET